MCWSVKRRRERVPERLGSPRPAMLTPTTPRPGHTLRALRGLHGDVVPVVDPLTDITHHVRLDRWAGSDPDAARLLSAHERDDQSSDDSHGYREDRERHHGQVDSGNSALTAVSASP